MTSSPNLMPAACSAATSAMVPLATHNPYFALCRSAKRCANSPAQRLGTGYPPQWPLSTTAATRSRSAVLCCGHFENFRLRRGVPPRSARLGVATEVRLAQARGEIGTLYLMRRILLSILAGASLLCAQNKISSDKEAAIKADLGGQIDAMKKQAQVMVDSVFSFAELGFQEFETSKYLTAILEKEGFKIERNYAGIPTAWIASWGSGK